MNFGSWPIAEWRVSAKGMSKRTITALKQRLQRSPDWTTRYTLLASCYVHLGRISESRSSISPVAIHAIMTARPFTPVGRFSPLGPRGIGIARFGGRRRRRRGRAHWQRVDGWMMSLSHVLARWNLHFCAVGVFDQHAILIAPTILDSADALRHRPPTCFALSLRCGGRPPNATFREFAIESYSVVMHGPASLHRAKHITGQRANVSGPQAPRILNLCYSVLRPNADRRCNASRRLVIVG